MWGGGGRGEGVGERDEQKNPFWEKRYKGYFLQFHAQLLIDT